MSWETTRRSTAAPQSGQKRNVSGRSSRGVDAFPSVIAGPLVVAREEMVEIPGTPHRAKVEGQIGRRRHEGVQLVLGRPGVAPPLVEEVHAARVRVVSVQDDVSARRHLQEVKQAPYDDVAI